MFQLQLVLAKSYLAIKRYLAINKLFIDEKLSGHKKVNQTRLQSRGPNSRTCVLVYDKSIFGSVLDHSFNSGPYTVTVGVTLKLHREKSKRLIRLVAHEGK